jgi:hypothetical protein
MVLTAPAAVDAGAGRPYRRRVLLKQATLEGIRAGTVDLQVRVWKRPTVKAGGTLTTRVGVLRILEVAPTPRAALTADDARRAGYPSKKALLESLRGREGQVYRIHLRLEGQDPRVALRETPLRSDAERAEVEARLRRMDAASPAGPWTERYLRLVADNEGVRAPELAAREGLETAPFKARVRRLKALGLTESLKVGYRLSPRGRSLLARGDAG